MLFKRTLIGIACGITIAIAVTSFVTIWEWLENPGGIFRDEEGTNWRFVYDTAISWFVPTLLQATPLAVLTCLLWARVRHGPRERTDG